MNDQYWADHPQVVDWQYGVANGDTRLGFWEWSEKKTLAALDDES